MQFFGLDFTPDPCLRMEYVAGGSLDNHLEDISHFETVEVLRQITDALEYLHGLEPPIVHRDISPVNILVARRDPGHILIKFADFGLAKEGQELETMCGNSTYLAPEILESWALGSRHGYTQAVDIWSAGAVAVELLCGLPKSGATKIKAKGVRWHKEIRGFLEEYHSQTQDPLASFLLRFMVVMKPEERASAAECRRELMRLPHGSMDPRGSRGSRQSTGGNVEADEATVRPLKNQKTAIFRGPDEADNQHRVKDTPLDQPIAGVKHPDDPPSANVLSREKTRAQVEAPARNKDQEPTNGSKDPPKAVCDGEAVRSQSLAAIPLDTTEDSDECQHHATKGKDDRKRPRYVKRLSFQLA